MLPLDLFAQHMADAWGLLLFCLRPESSSCMREKLVSHPGESHSPSGLAIEPCSDESFCLSALRAIRAAPMGDESREESDGFPSSAIRSGAGLLRPAIISPSGSSEGASAILMGRRPALGKTVTAPNRYHSRSSESSFRSNGCLELLLMIYNCCAQRVSETLEQK